LTASFLVPAAVALCIVQMSARAASLRGTIVDPTLAPVPGVRVLLKVAGAGLSTHTGPAGAFRFDHLTPGDYELQCDVPGFEPVRRRIRIGTRDPAAVTVRLTLATLKERLNIDESGPPVAPQPGKNADAVSVGRSMLDSLPFLDLNYLEAMARFLDPGMPGGMGTSLVVDGMEMRNAGVTASAIQEIRINNNPYAAEYPRWSRRRIEIITKSSADSYHGTLNFVFRDHRLNARDAFARERPLEQRRIVEGSLFGPLLRSRKTSFLLSGAREEDDLVAVVFAQGLNGAIRQNVPRPQVNSVASLRISRQFSAGQAMFWQYNFQDRWQNNNGVGGSALAETGVQSRFREDEFIVNHRVLLSQRLLSQFRILLGRYWAPNKSNYAAPHIVVSGAFSGGGAQADRLQTEVHTSITWLLTQSMGHHTLKYGFNVPDWSRRGLADRTNQAGSLSFASLADFAANRPFAAVIQRGDPRVIFFEKNLGAFFQDEWQLRPNISIAAGLRYDWQGYFGDNTNFAPRLAIAYAPRRSQKTVLRAGGGFFFDRSGPGPIWDVLRYNGSQLHRYVLTAGEIPADINRARLDLLPTSVHRLSSGVELPDTMQFSAGVERQLAARTTLAVNYTGVRGVQNLRSRDANAPLPPVFGPRPDARFSAIRVIESAGRLEANSLEITLRGQFRSSHTVMAQYAFGKAQSDTGGVNWFPAASYAPSGEWGRTDTDRRHQFNLLGAAALHRWANFGFSVSVLSGIPFNITTGADGNRDGMALDRPAGVGRNTGQGPGLAVVDLRWYREFLFRPEKKEKSSRAVAAVDTFNLFNRLNYQNFVGALSSPFFGRAVAAHPARRLQLSVRLQF